MKVILSSRVYFILIRRMEIMKKIVFEIIQVVIAYVIITIYSYYSTPEPDNKYSWLISAIIIIIIYSIIKLASKKKE